MSTKKFVHFVIVLAVGLALAGCERTKIGDITADPGRYMNKEVSVWVLASSRGVPSKGAHVGVKGHISPTVTFMGTNYATVMRESDRRSAE